MDRAMRNVQAVGKPDNRQEGDGDVRQDECRGAADERGERPSGWALAEHREAIERKQDRYGGHAVHGYSEDQPDSPGTEEGARYQWHWREEQARDRPEEVGAPRTRPCYPTHDGPGQGCGREEHDREHDQVAGSYRRRPGT